MNNISLSEIAAKLLSSHRILLLSHTSPDGDTVGSVTGLAVALEHCGKQVVCLCDRPIPERNLFICGSDRYLTDCEISEDDLVVTVDVASPQMLGGLTEKFAERVDIRIDHHDSATDFATFNYVESDSAACAEIVYELVTLLPTPITPEIAGPLYTSLHTDTGGFKFSNTTPRTHRIAATLIEAGAPAEEICETLYENVSLDSLRTNALFLEKMELYKGGKILMLSITMADKAKYDFSDEHLEGLASLTRKIAGVQLGIVLREKDNGSYKASMRSRRSVNCAELCAQLGGGGHIRAAGATVEADSFEGARQVLIDLIERVVINENSEETAEGQNA